MPGRKWTAKQKKQQAEAIHRWRPWDHSTGPRTAEGKAVSAQNALKHGVRSKVVKDYQRVVRENRKAGLFDVEAQEKIEAAREVTINYLIGRLDCTDKDAVINVHEFFASQAVQDTKKFWKVHNRMVQLARWDLHSIRRPREQS